MTDDSSSFQKQQHMNKITETLNMTKRNVEIQNQGVRSKRKKLSSVKNNTKTPTIFPLSNKSLELETRLDYNFYNVPCETLARSLLGKILVRRLECGTLLKGKIVETECYPGGIDKASHSYNGRKTPGNEPMYMQPGTAYVYFTYGMYHCFNISSEGPGAAVLLRALDPLQGIEQMQIHRKTTKRKKELKVHELCNGPSKLCISFKINKAQFNKADLVTNESFWIENSIEDEEIKIVVSSRIGIESAGEEWAKKPLRFYVLGNSSVSKRDKIVEQLILDRS